MGSSEIRKKPSQRRYLEKSGLDVWTSGRFVNVWNQPRKSRDVKECTCSHQEYSLDSRVFSECKSPFVSL
jgi:hypothetical protein